MSLIDNWLLILIITNFSLFLISLIVFIPKNLYETKIVDFYNSAQSQFLYSIIIVGVVVFHLIEVNIIDSYTTNWIGTDFSNTIHMIEGDRVIWFLQHWTPVLVYFFTFMYIAIYPFTLWFSPLYFILANEKKAMKTLSHSLVLAYLISLPFYLFIPVTNVYTFYGVESALEMTIPNIERFFYSTTTYNNCLPSLHVAVTLIIAKSISLTKNKRYLYFAYFCAASVIISVIYLAIHWITDVICGVVLALLVFYIQKWLSKEK